MRKKYDDPKERFRVYAEKHKERIRERGRKRYAENREKCNAQSKAWRERNKEKMKEIKRLSRIKHKDTAKRYYEENKERIYEQTKKWAQENKDKRRETYRKYRMKNPHKNIENNVLRRQRILKTRVVKFTSAQLRERLSVFGNKCWMCGCEADQVDHVIPLSKGGMHVLSNLRPACGSCNRKKSDRIIHKTKKAA